MSAESNRERKDTAPRACKRGLQGGEAQQKLASPVAGSPEGRGQREKETAARAGAPGRGPGDTGWQGQQEGSRGHSAAEGADVSYQDNSRGRPQRLPELLKDYLATSWRSALR